MVSIFLLSPKPLNIKSTREKDDTSEPPREHSKTVCGTAVPMTPPCRISCAVLNSIALNIFKSLIWNKFWVTVSKRPNYKHRPVVINSMSRDGIYYLFSSSQDSYYYPHFTHEEIKTEKWSGLPKITKLENSLGKVQAWAIWLTNLCNFSSSDLTQLKFISHSCNKSRSLEGLCSS